MAATPTVGGLLPKKVTGIMTLDSLVDSFGGCGPFQIWLVCATYSAQLCAVWGMMFMAFGNYHSDWWCYGEAGEIKYELDANESLNFLGPRNWTTKVYIIKTLDGEENTSNTGSCDIIHTCKRVAFDPDSSTIVTEFGLICDHAWVESVIICVQMAGVFVGCFIGGFLGDRIGRRFTLYGHVAVHAVVNLVAVFSVSWQMFTCMRFVIGLCIGGILSCSFLYPIEFVSQWWRGLLGSLPVWNVGAATFSIAVLLLKDWRHLHMATAALSALVFLPVFWVPESMRWLAVHGKVDKAKIIANRVASMNRKPPPNTTILELISREEKKKGRQKGSNYQYSFIDLFWVKYFRDISIKMGFVWACMSAVYYAITFGVKFLSGDFYINFIIFSVAEIPGMLFVAPASNRLGRRLASLLYFFFIALACLSVVLVSFAAPENVQGITITVLALLAKMHILAVWMIVTVFCSELYPTVIRNLSIGYLNSCARIGGIVAPYLIPNIIGYLYIMFLVMGLGLLGCCIILMSFPETKGKPLEDTIRSRSQLSIIIEETEFELRISESA